MVPFPCAFMLTKYVVSLANECGVAIAPFLSCLWLQLWVIPQLQPQAAQKWCDNNMTNLTERLPTVGTKLPILLGAFPYTSFSLVRPCVMNYKCHAR